MTVMYSGSVGLWGMSTAANMLGRLGPSVGWALFVGGGVVSSNVGGFLNGEWKHTGGKPLAIMVVGVVLMVLAMALIGHGNFLLKLQVEENAKNARAAILGCKDDPIRTLQRESSGVG